MLDRLVESKDQGKEKRALRRYLVGIGSLTTFFFASGLIFSIFATNLAMSGEGLNVSELIAPANIPQPAPEPEPEPVQKTVTENTSQKVKETTRAVNMLRVDEAPSKVPDKISVSKNKYEARPRSNFVVNGIDKDATPVKGTKVSKGTTTGSGLGTEIKNTGPKVIKPEVKKTTTPPPPLKKPQKTIVRQPTEVITGSAIYLAQPRTAGAITTLELKGQIRVNVVIGTNGRVISARAMNGHKLLQRAAAAAAKRSKFRPTMLNKVPVKVSGIIIYNFK